MEYDPRATGYVDEAALRELVAILPAPLGVGGEKSPTMVGLIVKRVEEIPGYVWGRGGGRGCVIEVA